MWCLWDSDRFKYNRQRSKIAVHGQGAALRHRPLTRPAALHPGSKSWSVARGHRQVSPVGRLSLITRTHRTGSQCQAVKRPKRMHSVKLCQNGAAAPCLRTPYPSNSSTEKEWDARPQNHSPARSQVLPQFVQGAQKASGPLSALGTGPTSCAAQEQRVRRPCENRVCATMFQSHSPGDWSMHNSRCYFRHVGWLLTEGPALLLRVCGMVSGDAHS